MPICRRAALLASAMLILSIAGASAGPSSSPGERLLGAGRAALGQGDLAAGIARLAEAAALLDPTAERAALALAYQELGLAYARSPGRGEEALIALTRSAALAAEPATALLWAAAVAEQLGKSEEAVALKERALRALGPAGTPPASAPATSPAPAAAPDPAPTAPPPAAAAEIGRAHV